MGKLHKEIRLETISDLENVSYVMSEIYKHTLSERWETDQTSHNSERTLFMVSLLLQSFHKKHELLLEHLLKQLSTNKDEDNRIS